MELLLLTYVVLGVISLFMNKPSFGKVFMKILFLLGMFIIAVFILFMFIESPVPLWAWLVSGGSLLVGIVVSFRW